MGKLEISKIPPLLKSEVLVVRPDMWTKITEILLRQESQIADLEDEVSKLKIQYEQQHEQIKIVAEALGGIYEEDDD